MLAVDSVMLCSDNHRAEPASITIRQRKPAHVRSHPSFDGIVPLQDHRHAQTCESEGVSAAKSVVERTQQKSQKPIDNTEA